MANGDSSLNTDRLRARYPAVSYLYEAARRRIPHFAWEYLDSGTGLETATTRNRAALDAVLLEPRFLRGYQVPDTSVQLFGRQWRAPLAVAPIGLAGMMWPQAELLLARAAAAHELPFCLSMVACETPETVGPATGGTGWFQLYPIADAAVEAEILARAKASAFEVLVVTVDVPINSSRERQRKAGVTGAGGRSISKLAQAAVRPAWLAGTARRGVPSPRTIGEYATDNSITGVLDFMKSQQMGAADTDHLERIRGQWNGPLVIKGILDPVSAGVCAKLGANAIVVSNHGARQMDAAPASIDVLATIAAARGGEMEILFDSGIRTGLDITRASALGARLSLSGRAFMYGVCVAGEAGAGLVADILVDDLSNNMMQLGVAKLDELGASLMQ
jgi:L-lactate dehydrogenase (cytochrome)